jgi:hypothetical protein
MKEVVRAGQKRKEIRPNQSLLFSSFTLGEPTPSSLSTQAVPNQYIMTSLPGTIA